MGRRWRETAEEFLGAGWGRLHREGVAKRKGEKRRTEKDEMAKSSEKGRGCRNIHRELPGKRTKKARKPWGKSGGKQVGREDHQIGSP